MSNRIKTSMRVLLLAVCAAAAYLTLWPVPIRPVAWSAPASRGYKGAHAKNDGLARLSLIALGAEFGPEHVVLAHDGRLYASMASGHVLRMHPDGTEQEVFVDTGGRVLGFDFDAGGRLIAADAMKGLLAVDTAGEITLLTDEVDGDPIRFANGVVVARSGKIYFSDASCRFAPAQWGDTHTAALLEILEQGATGRVLEYDPVAGTTRVVARGLSLANGVSLSGDERFLFVAETGRYRVWRIHVEADDLDVRHADASRQATVLLDNLPGFPDNLTRGRDGRTWLGFSSPRSPKVDGLAGRPFLRELAWRLPQALRPPPERYGHVIAFDDAGHVVADLQDPSGAYAPATGVTETADRLYVPNLHLNVLGWQPR